MKLHISSVFSPVHVNAFDHVRLGDAAVVGEADLDDADDRERLLLHIPVWPVLNEMHLENCMEREGW